MSWHYNKNFTWEKVDGEFFFFYGGSTLKDVKNIIKNLQNFPISISDPLEMPWNEDE
jgi:hypothetical protein